MEGGTRWRRESQLLDLSISGVAYLLQGNRLVRRDDFLSREGRKKACLVLVSGCSIRGHELLWAGRDFNTVGTANENTPVCPCDWETATHACGHSQL